MRTNFGNLSTLYLSVIFRALRFASIALAFVSFFPTVSAQTEPALEGLRTDRIDQPTPLNVAPDMNFQMEKQALRRRDKAFQAINARRMHEIADESAKLLILTRDLKRRLELSEEKTLSPILMDEAAVIEKLARDVQAKMITIVGGG